MKDMGPFTTPFENAICPIPTGDGAGARDLNGVEIPDGKKGSAGEMPEVNGISVEGDAAPGKDAKLS